MRLIAMPDRGGFRVVLTVRVDYFNLCRSFASLHDSLEADHSVLRLKRISDEGLESAVRKPLRMAGYADEESSGRSPGTSSATSATGPAISRWRKWRCGRSGAAAWLITARCCGPMSTWGASTAPWRKRPNSRAND
jgi:hypothetical protein